MAVFEVKYSKSLKGLEKDCEKAIAQIDSRRYAEEFEDDYSHFICCGISFFKKRCMIKIK